MSDSRSRIDTLEDNIVAILKADGRVTQLLGDKANAIFARRTAPTNQRNLGKAPYITVDSEYVERHFLCDMEDEVTCRVNIVTTFSAKKEYDRRVIEQITLALYAVDNFNEPDDCGVINDWTLNFETDTRDGETIGTITVNLRLTVPTGEV